MVNGSSLLRTKQLPPLRKIDILKRKGVKTVQVTVNYDSYARWIEKRIYIFAPQTKNNWLSWWGRCLLLSFFFFFTIGFTFLPLKLYLWSKVGFLFSLNFFFCYYCIKRQMDILYYNKYYKKSCCPWLFIVVFKQCVWHRLIAK